MLNKSFFTLALFFVFRLANAQYSPQVYANTNDETLNFYTYSGNSVSGRELPEPIKIRKQRFGTILGLQRGEITNFTVGAEWQFKKKALLHPSEWATNFSLEYNFGNNILGYRLGAYHKKGRVALTYGGSLCYLTDFEEGGSLGITPNIGFKLLGFHLNTGYNFMFTSDNLKKYNSFYVGLVYYFPVSSDTDIIRNKKKKKDKGSDSFFKRVFKK
jgi:hypothetical protein